MSTLPRSSRLASPVDTTEYGEYRINRRPGDPRPLYRFTGRVERGVAGRYHIYAGWFCPWAQRVTIARELAGLGEAVSVSYVDNARDGRGWAFRERYGPDPVNGFALLRQAYEKTEPGFDGHVSVPALWDKTTGSVLSNDYRTIGIDLATRFRDVAEPLVEAYPEPLRDEIEELTAWLAPGISGDETRARFTALDERLATRRYLVGPTITEADIRLYVALVRYGSGLTAYPNLWAYARDLYTVPAFRDTTDFSTYGDSGAAGLDWSEPAHRPERSHRPFELLAKESS
ncbi:glutathione S-transferase C-terminal domain-containing protein [Dactylosporangium salmoneum]|uniref:Glutathione S-transferase C-terminal domain-containing protein n=1 Tax=Dactylosporangium salmoneum TaxID=53361 RepID=A0ABP5V8H0_9ACTN